MSIAAMILSVVGGTASMYWGYAGAGYEQPARWLFGLGALWLFTLWQRWNWFGALALLVHVAAAGLGLWIGLPAGLMTLGVVGALFGWDLSAFVERLRFASAQDDVRGMELRHLGRVAIVAALSLGLAGLTTVVRVRMPFELAVLLVLVTTFGLTRTLVWLQRSRGE